MIAYNLQRHSPVKEGFSRPELFFDVLEMESLYDNNKDDNIFKLY